MFRADSALALSYLDCITLFMGVSLNFYKHHCGKNKNLFMSHPVFLRKK
jgi:hypothetical protein